MEPRQNRPTPRKAKPKHPARLSNTHEATTHGVTHPRLGQSRKSLPVALGNQQQGPQLERAHPGNGLPTNGPLGIQLLHNHYLGQGNMDHAHSVPTRSQPSMYSSDTGEKAHSTKAYSASYKPASGPAPVHTAANPKLFTATSPDTLTDRDSTFLQDNTGKVSTAGGMNMEHSRKAGANPSEDNQ